MIPEEYARQQAIKAEFKRLHNMKPDKLSSHLLSEASDFASLDPRVAKRLNQQSGKTLGKRALSLMQKEEWEEADYSLAESLIKPLRLQLTRKDKIALTDANGNPSLYSIALMNRGHDPLIDTTVQVAEAEMSMSRMESYLRQTIREYMEFLFNPLYEQTENVEANEKPGISVYVQDIFLFSGYAIVSVSNDELYQVSFQFQTSPTESKPIVTVTGPPILVEPTFVPVNASDDSPSGEMLEVTESIETGVAPVWTATMIKAGAAVNLDKKSGKRRFYPADVLKIAVAEGVFDNVMAYQRDDVMHLQQKGFEPVGKWGKARWDEDRQAVVNTLHWNVDKYPAFMHMKFVESLRTGQRDKLPGFSIVGSGKARKDDTSQVALIERVTSCDPISFPSAGGELIHIQESVNNKEQNAMDPKTIAKFMQAIQSGNIKTADDLKSHLADIKITEGAAVDYMISVIETDLPEIFEGDDSMKAKLQKDEMLTVKFYKMALRTKGAPAPAPETGTDPIDGGLTEAQLRTLRNADIMLLNNALSSSGLDNVMQDSIRKRFAAETNINIDTVNVAIREAKDIAAHYEEKGGSSMIRISRDNTDAMQEMVNSFFFQDVTNRTDRIKIIEAVGPNVISKDTKGTVRSLTEMYRMLFPNDRGLSFDASIALVEAMDSAIATKLLTNGINARLAYEWQLASAYDDWRVFTNIVPVFDYQTKTAMAYGGYTGWSDNVTKGSDFPALDDDKSTAETYTAVRRGGIVTISEIDIRNDNVGYVASIPTRLNKEAKRRMSALPWSLITSNPTLASDSKTLFHTDHLNIVTDPIGSNTLRTMIGLLQNMPHPNSTDILMTRPAFIGSGADPILQETIYKLITVAADQNNNTPAWAQAKNLRAVVNPHTTDTDDCYLFGDKQEVPIVEMGVLDGNETPEVVVSQIEGVGSWFTAGDAKWRVKQAYNGTVVSHRGVIGCRP